MSEKKTSELVAIIARYEALYQMATYALCDINHLNALAADYVAAAAELNARVDGLP
jgi:hypothetical protein